MLFTTNCTDYYINWIDDDDEERRKGGVGIRDVVRVGLLLAWDHHQDKDDEAEDTILQPS